MIFPTLQNKIYGYVNLDLEARSWCEKNMPQKASPSPFLDPNFCQKFIEDTHKKYNLVFSYGGWMEDRSYIWEGGYLSEKDNFIHLGIDINVPAGTKVAFDFEGEVVRVDNDYPVDGGWGPHVVVKHASHPVYVIYAHLENEILCKVGDKAMPGVVFGKIGIAPFNGNWFPHVHVQVIEAKYWEEVVTKNPWSEFDGYGLKSELETLASRYPDPLNFISLF